ncbi:NAD(P)H-hydrate dehydratase [Agitococcus lubricus]|uniref:Bifunctional NAD(P)H-hydrate repair enzyme n=1 Tax=Agitococcus lubricus TaxID=1077255 RepID=A0A2T5IZK7_9GAMM|nr:NAD(P)H-hydrate dehydratase [Agitococcus lubricus]PTQ89497.1 NAD(P)H-hydrate epimerase [Agitococcus lubricus]
MSTSHLLEQQLFTSQQIRDTEQRAFADGLFSEALMQQAGHAVFQTLTRRFPQAKRLIICCGAGNNGGDGYVLAYLAQQAGYQVSVIYTSPPKTHDAQTMLGRAQACGVKIEGWQQQALCADVIVDALLGIGLNAPVQGQLADLITAINNSACPVVAVDVPSGINADTGQVMGHAVRAHITVCFIGHKIGLWTGQACDYVGHIHLQSLNMPASYYPSVAIKKLTDTQLCFPKRAKDSHKGDFGHVLVIGGGEGMGGAVMMTAEACLRVGAGRVTVATHPEHVMPLLARCPELMVRGVQQPKDLLPLLTQVTVIVIGMGLGRNAWGQALWQAVQDCPQPLVVDADALYFLAQQPKTKTNWVLTPHAAEAGRLLAKPYQQIDNDRLNSLQALMTQYQGIVLLKGCGSLIGHQQTIQLCPYGNAGMATAGMGDTLAGIMAGLISQFGFNLDIVAKAVLLHALAGDEAAKEGERGVIATDLFKHLRSLLNRA